MKRRISSPTTYCSLSESASRNGVDKAMLAHLKKRNSSCMHHHWKIVYCPITGFVARDSMWTNVRAGLKVTCPFDFFLNINWYPHAVQVALTTNRIGTLGKERSAMKLQKVIAAWDAAGKAVEGSSMGRGREMGHHPAQKVPKLTVVQTLTSISYEASPRHIRERLWA